MDNSVKIRLGNLLQNSKNFNFLRQQGIQLIQQLASVTWTDHNLHDPGITLLETLCYALTEAGTQAGAASALDSTEDLYTYMANLLTSGQQMAPQEFFTCSQVLPSSPVSLTDFQKMLLDHPRIKRAWVSVNNGIPAGNLSVLQQFNSADSHNDLNSNILSSEVTVLDKKYQIEIAFPYWDDPETVPFQNDVAITNLVFNPILINPWVPISGTDSFFTFLNFSWNGNPASWPIVLRIVGSSNEIASSIRDNILTGAASNLITPSTNPPLLKQYNQKVMMAFESSHRIRSYLKNYRNLCETFSTYRSVRIQEVGISAIIEMSAGADIERILANIFSSVYLLISPHVIPQSLSNLQSQLPTEAIFEGPLLKHGFIRDSLYSSNLPSNTLYVSDVIRLIMEMGTGTDIQTREDNENRPVMSVTNVSLSLYLDNRSIMTGARDCLQLINNSHLIPQLSLEKCNITITRNNTVVTFDLNKVHGLYNEQINAANIVNVISQGTPTDIPVPVGESLALGDYYSIQDDLPFTYGVGKAGLPASSSTQRIGQAKQLQGYLFLFEQVLAGYFSQLAHVNASFSANATASATLYQLPLYHVPAASDLLLPLVPNYTTWQDFINDAGNPYIQILTTGPETEEQSLNRRHQMLDHLLGRLGEDMQAFSSLIYRQSYSNPNSSASSTSAALLQFKADYYYALPDLEKNRAQAYGHPAWRKKGLVNVNLSPEGTFFLWQILDENGTILFRQSVTETNKAAAEETAESAMTLATNKSNYFTETDLNGLQRIALRWSAGEQSIAISNTIYATVADAENDIPLMSQSVLNLWLKYCLSSLETRLYHLLGIANKGERRQLINPLGTNEGFYIIEHLLLYPVSTGDTALIFPDSPSSCLPVSESGIPYSLPKDSYSFTLTIAFPSGYARDFSDTNSNPLKFETQPDRFRDIEFLQYAEQTIRKFCPAHILPLVVWVDTALAGTALVNSSNKPHPCFDNLESTYMSWLSDFFTDDVDPSVIALRRNNLVSVLNGIFADLN